MNSDERQLITDLFGRMQSHGLAEKDPQAAALIAERVRAMPDAPYMLVQSVLVQEMALQQADQRIRELEDQMADLEQQRVPVAGASGGSFLGGLFGGSPSPAPRPASRGSVPAMGARPVAGSRPQSSGAHSGAASATSTWGGAASGSPGAQAQAAPSAGGGFMRSAMTTAAGVAGGMLLADGIRNMMNGDAAKPATTDTAAADAAADAQTDAELDQADYQDPASNDPGVQDAGGYDDGGGDFGGGDFDV